MIEGNVEVWRIIRILTILTSILFSFVSLNCHKEEKPRVSYIQEPELHRQKKDTRTFLQRERDRIKASKIKSQKLIEHKYHFGTPDKEGSLEYFRQYDTLGQVLFAIPSYGGSTLKYKYAYDKTGDRIREENWEIARNVCIAIFHYLHKADTAGNAIEILCTQGNDVQTKTFNKYDSLGNLTEEAVYGGNGKLDHRNYYEYESNGLMIESVGFLKERRIMCRSSYRYDGTGILIERIDYDTQNEPEVLVKYLYDFY